MAGQVLDQMAAGYAPVASGYQPQFRSGFEGAPLVSSHPVMAMMAQPALMNMMSGVGMVPMGTGHDQNAYDTLRHRMFNAQQRQAMANVSYLERENAMRTFRGVAAMSGTPFGAEQRRAAGGLADMMAYAAPMAAMMAPELLDQMGGMRGSATVMTNRMMQAGRYQMDPVTGRLGIDASSMGRMASDLYRDTYGSRQGIMGMSGLSAGQIGGLYEGLASRGMIGMEAGSLQDRTRRAVGDMTAPDLQQAMSRQNVTNPANKLDASDIDKLALDPAVGDKLRSFDAGRVARAIKSYSGAIAAVRDIFGDAGRPNAPMNQLIQSLEAMTMGTMSQMNPERAGQIVRQTYNLAKNTGVSMDSAMVMQQHAANKAAQLGLEPVFAMAATQGGMAYGGAFRGMGLGAHTAWGAMNSDQLQQADMNLRLGASSSNAANRLAVVMRMSRAYGGFSDGSDAAGLVNAVQGGFSQFRGADGSMRDIGSLGQRDFYSILTGAKGRQGQNLGIRENDVREMLSQRFDNREAIDADNIGRSVRNQQGAHQVIPFITERLRESMAMRLTQAGVSRGIADSSMKQAGRKAMDRIMGLSTEEFSDPGRRNSMMAEILEDELSGTEAGAALAKMKPLEREAFFKGSAARFYGRANEALRSSGFRTNMQDAHKLFDPRILEKAGAIEQQAAFDSSMQTALSPLGRGTVLQRAMEAVQNARPGDNMTDVVAAALGGVKTSDISSRVARPVVELNNKVEAIKSLQADIQRTPAGASRANMEKRLASMLTEANSQAAGIAKSAADFGFFGEGDIKASDTRSALDTSVAVASGVMDLASLRGGFGTTVDKMEANKTWRDTDYSGYVGGPGGRGNIKDYEAAAVIMARREHGPIDDETLSHATAAMRRKKPYLSKQEAEDAAKAEIRANRKANIGMIDPAEIRQEMTSGKLGSPAEAAALILVRRQKTDLRPTDGQVSATLAEMRRTHPQATEEDARDLATTRQRAQRWGILPDELAEIQSGAAKAGHRLTEQQALASAVDARQRNYFEGTTEERKAKDKERTARFDKFWASEDGIRFRENVGAQEAQAEATAEKLLNSPEVVRRFGTQAVEFSKKLREVAQRRRVLAFQYAGGDVNRLVAGDYRAANAEEESKIQREIHGLHGIEHGIYRTLHGTHGEKGHQFRMGTKEEAMAVMAGFGVNDKDEAKSRHARWIAAGKPAGDTFTYMGKTETYSEEQYQTLMRQMREGKGDFDEAAGLLGMTKDAADKLMAQDEGTLSPEDRAKREQLKTRAGLVGIARRLTGEEASHIKEFGNRDAAINRLAKRHGVTAKDLMAMVKGDKSNAKLSTLTDDEAQRRNAVLGDYESAQKAQTDANQKARQIERSIANLDRQLEKPGLRDEEKRDLEKRRAVATGRLADANNAGGVARRKEAAAALAVDADAKKRGVSGSEYLQGKGFLSTAERDRIIAEAAKMGKSVGELQELALKLNVPVESLADVTKNVIEPQLKMAEDARRAAQSGGMEAVQALAKEFGFDLDPAGRSAQELAAKFGDGAGRGWAKHISDTQRAIKEGGKGLRGGGTLASRWQEAMGKGAVADRDKALSQLQADLGIDAKTEHGRARWERLTESLDFQKRAGLLDGKDGKMSVEKVQAAYEKIRQGGEFRRDLPGQGGGGMGGWNGRIHGDLTIKGNVGSIDARTGGSMTNTANP